MNSKKFIEKAIEGGYDTQFHELEYHAFNDLSVNIFGILLDPRAWEAVGKVEGWREYDTSLVYSANESMDKMYKMIEHLEVIEGGTITSYLETL